MLPRMVGLSLAEAPSAHKVAPGGLEVEVAKGL